MQRMVFCANPSPFPVHSKRWLDKVFQTKITTHLTDHHVASQQSDEHVPSRPRTESLDELEDSLEKELTRIQSGVGTDGNDDNADAGAVDTGVLKMADTLEEDQLSSWKLYELLDGSARVCRNTIDAFVTASQSMLAMLRLG